MNENVMLGFKVIFHRRDDGLYERRVHHFCYELKWVAKYILVRHLHELFTSVNRTVGVMMRITEAKGVKANIYEKILN